MCVLGNIVKKKLVFKVFDIDDILCATAKRKIMNGIRFSVSYVMSKIISNSVRLIMKTIARYKLKRVGHCSIVFMTTYWNVELCGPYRCISSGI